MWPKKKVIEKEIELHFLMELKIESSKILNS